jgi:hypothetical protein
MTTGPFTAPPRREKYDDKLTVHCHAQFKVELEELATANGYLHGTRNTFWLVLLREGAKVVKAATGRKRG